VLDMLGQRHGGAGEYLLDAGLMPSQIRRLQARLVG
jgi:hypothetical protein